LPKKKNTPKTPGSGRKPGTPNKMTATAKEALTLAFQGIGGVPALTEWAKDNQTEFYKIWSRLLPQEVNAALTGKDGRDIIVKIIGGTASMSDL
jgi:hypothetical protein